MAAWRYEISLLVLKKYFTRLLRSLVKYFSTLEEEFCISVQPCTILYFFHEVVVLLYYLQIETWVMKIDTPNTNHLSQLGPYFKFSSEQGVSFIELPIQMPWKKVALNTPQPFFTLFSWLAVRWTSLQEGHIVPVLKVAAMAAFMACIPPPPLNRI